jgi:hypothetical protein
MWHPLTSTASGGADAPAGTEVSRTSHRMAPPLLVERLSLFAPPPTVPEAIGTRKTPRLGHSRRQRLVCGCFSGNNASSSASTLATSASSAQLANCE